MDVLTKWSAHIVDLQTLFGEWERRRSDGRSWTKRFREIHSICMFTLLIENGTDHRYLIGFQQHGLDRPPATLSELFGDNFGEIEDCDVLLIDDPKKYGPSAVLHHRCQLVSYINQPSICESDVVSFLEKKKLRVAADNDLRLIIHVEQEGCFNFLFLSLFLQHRQPKCPYSQVFAFGQNGTDPRKWFCAQVYPDLALLPELDEHTARKLVLDREPYTKVMNAGQA